MIAFSRGFLVGWGYVAFMLAFCIFLAWLGRRS